MDRITRIHLQNVRAVESMALDIGPLTVLFGEGGSGKSTALEGLEILREAVEPSFFARLRSVHGGMPALVRRGAAGFALRVVIEDLDENEPWLEYTLSLASQGGEAVVDAEVLVIGPTEGPFAAWPALRRTREGARLFDPRQRAWIPVPVGANELAFSLLERLPAGPVHRALERLATALRGIEVHRGELPTSITTNEQASWQAFVDLLQRNEERSLLALDDVERRLHPAVLGRALAHLTSLDDAAPVVLATQSDRALSFVEDPVGALRVLAREGEKAALYHVVEEELAGLLEEYGDLGRLRASGDWGRVLVRAQVEEVDWGE